MYYYIGKHKKDIYQSNSQQSTLGSLIFDPVTINCSILDSFTPDTNIMIDFVEDKFMGTSVKYKAFLTIGKLSQANNEFILLEAIDKSNSMQAFARQGASKQVLTYLDFVEEGVKYVPIFAIDFSLANLTLDNNKILHHINPLKPNIYLNTIKSVSEMLSPFSEFMIGYGFGAKVIQKRSETSSCFALNGTFFNPIIEDEESLVKCYQDSLKRVEVSLPVNMKNIIKIANQFAYSEMESQKFKRYFLLIVICAGVIDDFDETIYECMRMSSLPISLVLIKVGNLHQNDSDIEELASCCKKSSDQRKFLNIVEVNSIEDDIYKQMRECLSKVPWQSLQFYKQFKGRQRASISKSKKERSMQKVLEEMQENFTRMLEQNQWTQVEINDLYNNRLEDNDLWLANFYRSQLKDFRPSPPDGSIMLDDKKKLI